MLRISLVTLLAAALLPAQDRPLPPKGGAPTRALNQGYAKSNTWFAEAQKDLGTYFNNEAATGTFHFRNPTDKAIEWRSMTPSCTCSSATITIGDRCYEMAGKPHAGALTRIKKGPKGEERETVNLIQVDPGEEGDVEVHMELHGYTGVKSARLDIHTTDPNEQMMTLAFSATGAQMFTLTPAEVSLNTMTWNESREFTVQVTSTVQKDFNIVNMDTPPEGFKVDYKKDLKDGAATWTVHGTYGPLASEVGAGGVLRFVTDVPGGAPFQLRVQAYVKGPMEIKPGTFLTMGMIKKGSARAEKVVFTPNDNTKLEATKISLEKLSVPEEFVTTRTSNDGNSLIVEVEISKDCPTGLVRGDMVVELNHPAIKEKRILFNGYVR